MVVCGRTIPSLWATSGGSSCRAPGRTISASFMGRASVQMLGAHASYCVCYFADIDHPKHAMFNLGQAPACTPPSIGRHTFRDREEFWRGWGCAVRRCPPTQAMLTCYIFPRQYLFRALVAEAPNTVHPQALEPPFAAVGCPSGPPKRGSHCTELALPLRSTAVLASSGPARSIVVSFGLR